MKELLTDFTLAQIITITIGLLLAAKGAIGFFVYFKELYDKKFNKDYAAKQKENLLEDHYKNCKEQSKMTVQLCNQVEEKLDHLKEDIDDKFEALDQRIDNLDEQINTLTISDMHDIKQAITEAYHHHVEQEKWIDDFTLNCLEHRYDDYKKENGNSFVGGMMEQIRKLPRKPPKA